MSVWCVMFFETDSHMRVCLNLHWNFRQLVSVINISFRQLGGPIRSVIKIEYYCPYITPTNASPYDTYLYYWDHIENDLDAVCMFFTHSGEVS